MGVISLVRGQQSEDNYYLIDAVKTENKAETTRTTPEQNSDSVVENVVLWVKLCEINYPNMERWFSTMTLIFPFLYDRLQFEGCWEHWFDTKLFYSRTTSSLRLPLRLLDILIITPITAADSEVFLHLNKKQTFLWDEGPERLKALAILSWRGTTSFLPPESLYFLLYSIIVSSVLPFFLFLFFLLPVLPFPFIIYFPYSHLLQSCFLPSVPCPSLLPHSFLRWG